MGEIPLPWSDIEAAHPLVKTWDTSKVEHSRYWMDNLTKTRPQFDYNPEWTDDQLISNIQQGIRSVAPYSFEHGYSTGARVDEMKTQLQSMPGRTLLVGHSYFFKFWTGEWHDEAARYS